ncbi:PepSY domain-containing protein [Arthrobacter sp. NPDC056691]|uniref:PepSY domain-containing protein n=1 Tax=Arthrobacter sp. NPDC056691 TaxID=3345913 RepID=UPI0036707C6C
MNQVRKIAAGTALLGAIIGGGALTAAALPANAATTTASPTSSTTPNSQTHGNETALTGDTADKVKAAVLAANSGATVDEMTTEDDGSAAYEAHITKSDGTHATVKLDANYAITATESGGHGGHGRHGNSNEPTLTGDTADKVKAAVLAANSGATVDEMTTEDDGSAAYEAHITKSDGTRATVKLDANYAITATETGGHGH